MPQEIRIVKCYKCSTYQTDIVKNAKKWTCKMCNEKQSIVQEYGRGSGKDCRLQVQKLNEKKMGDEIVERSIILSTLEKSSNSSSSSFPVQEATIVKHNDVNNKWLKYMENQQKDEQESNTTFKIDSIHKDHNIYITAKKPLKRLSKNKFEVNNYCNALNESPLKNFAIKTTDTDLHTNSFNHNENIDIEEQKMEDANEISDNNLTQDRTENMTNYCYNIDISKDNKIKRQKGAENSKWSQFIDEESN